MKGRAGRPNLKCSTRAARAAAEGKAAAVPPPTAVEERAAAAVLPTAASNAGRASGAGAPSGRRPPISWLTAAPAGAGAPDDSGSYSAFPSAGAGVGRRLDALGNYALPAPPAALLGGLEPDAAAAWNAGQVQHGSANHALTSQREGGGRLFRH